MATKKTGVILTLLASVLFSASVLAGSESYPSKMDSFQPFQKFGRGEGKGYAYSYHNRSKEELVSILRNTDVAKKEMRVSCETLVRQMAEVNQDLPFESCEGAASAIESDAYTIEECGEYLNSNALAITNENGSRFGVWSRRCLSGEKVLVHGGKPLLSLLCLNTMTQYEPLVIPITKGRPQSLEWRSATQVTQREATCSNKAIELHVWDSPAQDVCAIVGGSKRCVREFIGNRPRPDGSDDKTYKSEVSGMFGGTFRSLNAAGSLDFSKQEHHVLATIRRGGQHGQEHVLYEGPVIEKKLIDVPEFRHGDEVVIYFRELTSFPSYRGLEAGGLPFCTNALHAIAGDGEQVSQAP